VNKLEQVKNKKDKKDAKVHKENIEEALNKKIKELEEKMLYKDAELINYRKRKDDEVSNMLKYANSDIILELLSIVDDLERAIKIDDEVLDDELSKFLSGFKIIYSKLVNLLNNFEVKEIDTLNKEFDPSFHQAVMTKKIENVKTGTVIDVLQKGYMYKDRVIRPSMVIVAE
jgi:molecular chaperone GrpE